MCRQRKWEKINLGHFQQNYQRNKPIRFMTLLPPIRQFSFPGKTLEDPPYMGSDWLWCLGWLGLGMTRSDLGMRTDEWLGIDHGYQTKTAIRGRVVSFFHQNLFPVQELTSLLWLQHNTWFHLQDHQLHRETGEPTTLTQNKGHHEYVMYVTALLNQRACKLSQTLPQVNIA